ncbi:uncharacterized protein DUF4232 [Antricoccus suffuscus]|uniref:Uncharacterized protein DUF4232 n=1 Tax=Antricoccus suffuscus TaxID=1629062 RepID=A0A2T1A2D6_9ACTN|nr:DUF4232 domain-containing protein [Antricoccus suffuscus]PRZ42694.1 uncharacterized protein DUF4232 [Antricoccus suffuscus]
MRTTRAIQIASIAILGLGAAGCSTAGSSGHAGSPSGGSGSQATGQSNASQSSVSGASGTSTSASKAPTAGSQDQSQAAGSTAPICAAVNLTFAAGQPDGAAGSTYQPVVLTNKGTATCTLTGFPGVSFVAGDDGHQVGNAADKDKSKSVTAVTLAPGAKAQFVVRIAQAGNYDPSSCQPVAARGLRIYTPGETHSAFLPLDVQACSTTAQNQLTTGPVTAS